MEIYKLSFQDTFLGTLTVDTVTGMSTLSPKDPGGVRVNGDGSD